LGAMGLARRFLADRAPDRCPNTTTDVVSMAPSTRLAGSDSVSNRMPGISMDEASSSLREAVGNSFLCSVLSAFHYPELKAMPSEPPPASDNMASVPTKGAVQLT